MDWQKRVLDPFGLANRAEADDAAAAEPRNPLADMDDAQKRAISAVFRAAIRRCEDEMIASYRDHPTMLLAQGGITMAREIRGELRRIWGDDADD